MRPPQSHWIGGRALAEGSDPLPVRNPATEEVLDHIPAQAGAAVDEAVAAARQAFPAWAARSPGDRKALLDRAAALLEQHAETLARQLTLEMGKPLAQSRGEVGASAELVRQMGVLSLHLRAGSQMAAGGFLNFQQRVARGVAAVIVPWNYPLVAGIESVAANLAVGNTVVWKPSEKTPLSSRLAVELAFGHLPAGVCNLLLGNGPGAGAPLVEHPGVALVVFIGSEGAGRRIGASCGRDLKKMVLELGGKDALIVDETVDVAAAARFAAEAAFANAGQICTSTERLYVARQVFDPFVEALAREAAAIRVGDGLDPSTQMGPIVDALQLDVIAGHVGDARARGATARHGGERLARPGYFFPPTVMTGVPGDSPLMSDETFGPVAPCVAFDDFEQALALANASRFGLSAIVCTESAPRALHAVHTLRAGMVRINTMRGRSPAATSEPFGASGIGHGYGVEFLQELTQQKSVYWRDRLP
ncbi:MAG TPA: aldehyde dehydrogenase family protein [Ramlibacter sp.]|nr:aldehyde dehydrogenase family protein [Ramlibacter sp.]